MQRYSNAKLAEIILSLGERFCEIFAFFGLKTLAMYMAGISADVTAYHNPGTFRSMRLENSLTKIAKSNYAEGVEPVNFPHNRRTNLRILHVITRANPHGGHFLWIQRICKIDVTNSHSVVLTSGNSNCIPAEFENAINSSGGSIISLGKHSISLFAASQKLKRLSSNFDVVVVSAHPGDTIPLVAFANKDISPPIIYMNHSDHLFWLGLSIADIVVEFREIGVKFSNFARGYPQHRQFKIPLPIDPPESIDDVNARRLFGIADDKYILLSAGSSYKFDTNEAVDFKEWVGKALGKAHQWHLVIVGPKPDKTWDILSSQLGGRLTLCPPTNLLNRFYSIADAFLNPFPIGSDTIMWEAASFGLAPIILKSDEPWSELLLGDSSEIRDGSYVFTDYNELADVLVNIAESGSLARQKNKAAQISAKDHLPDSSLSYLNKLLDFSLKINRVSLDELSEVPQSKLLLKQVRPWQSNESLIRTIAKSILLR